MGLSLKITIFLLGVLFVLAVIYLLVKRRVNERNSFFWLAGSLVILVLSAMPEILEVIAGITGVDYPPALLFLMSTLVILFILLYQSIQISILQERCSEMAQQLAIVNFNEEMRRGRARWQEEGVEEGMKEVNHERSVFQSTEQSNQSSGSKDMGFCQRADLGS
jgi:hypothetical protein